MPKIAVSESPLQNFLKLFEEDLLEKIITEYNRYARQRNVDLNLTMDELKAF